MVRKRWQAETEITPALIKFRDKRKWQINLRRYVLQQSPCPQYAPYFGLDITNMRKWFEMQFRPGEDWQAFGKSWQFDHIVPVVYFDSDREEELKLCWNFTNLRVDSFQLNTNRGHRLDVLAAKGYFETLYNNTQYPICKRMLEKIDSLKMSEMVSTTAQQEFILQHLTYLSKIAEYSTLEFELLNLGKSIDEVSTELEFAKKFNVGPK